MAGSTFNPKPRRPRKPTTPKPIPTTPSPKPTVDKREAPVPGTERDAKSKSGRIKMFDTAKLFDTMSIAQEPSRDRIFNELGIRYI